MSAPVKSRPILFSAPMVCALLDGRKTQTRRTVKPRGGGNLGVRDDATVRQLTDDEWCFGVDGPRGWSSLASEFACPYGKPGDTLWVKETWAVATQWDRFSPSQLGQMSRRPAVTYLATDPPAGKTRVSIHMPRWASRITLEVTGVRVERLQSITEADAKAEGVENDMIPGRYGWKNYGDTETAGDSCEYFVDARDSFRSLWESINGADSWAANPWTWAISFRVVTP